MSRAKAINKHCKECIYDPHQEGTWRQQVENCTSTQCNLYPYRPVSVPKRIEGQEISVEGLPTHRVVAVNG